MPEETLRDLVTAPDQVRGKRTERADPPTDDGRANFDRPAAEPVHYRESTQQCAVVEVGCQPGNGAKRDEQQPRLDPEISQRLDREVRGSAEERTLDGNRSGGGAQCGDCDAGVEPPH